VSGSSRVRTAAALNHRIYADRLGVPYFFEMAPSRVARIYFHKLQVVEDFLGVGEWLFWIDDDAFFTDMEVDLRSFLAEAGDTDLVFCQSPINPKGGWTWMSSGQFFIRSSEPIRELIEAVRSTDLAEVRAWWQPDVHGLFTNGDQDAFVYQLLRADSPWRDRWVRLPWQAFNSRPYHYEARLDEHFLCHFAVPGGRPKVEVIAEFAERMGSTPALCAPELAEPYGVFLDHSEMGPIMGRAAPAPRPSATPSEGGRGRTGMSPSPSGSGWRRLLRRAYRRLGRTLR
jgi:hypothetical protein